MLVWPDVLICVRMYMYRYMYMNTNVYIYVYLNGNSFDTAVKVGLLRTKEAAFTHRKISF